MLALSLSSRTPLLARFLSMGGGTRESEKIQALAYHQGDVDESRRIRTTVHLFFPEAQQILSGYGLKFSTSPLNILTVEDIERGPTHFETALESRDLLASEVNTLFMRWQRLQTSDLLTREEYYKERKSVSIDTAFFIDSIGKIPLGVEISSKSNPNKARRADFGD